MTQSPVLADSPSAQLSRQALRFADHPLFILPQGVARKWSLAQQVWSYAEAVAIIETLRQGYRLAGYGAGHRVALLLENRPEHFFHWLALNGVGASIVPLNPDATTEEIGWLLHHSGAVLAVALPERLSQVSWHGVPAIPATDAPPPAPPRGETPDLPAAPEETATAECALIYTSGTTGKPKGCILSNLYFMQWGAWYCAQPAPVALRPGQERLMTPLPAFHVNAMGNSFMGMLASGGAQVIVDRFHPREWWDMAAETGATCFHYLGVMPAILLAIPETPGDRTHALRFGLGGGVHPDHHAAFETRFGVPLLEGWAMTETGGACLLSAVSAPRLVGTRCLGKSSRPGPEMECRLVDDAGADVAPGKAGELWVRAGGGDPRRGLFSGYLNDPAATAAIWEGGWLHTGDIMRLGPEGTLHFMDRKKNVIRRSGENIAALEVEGVLNGFPQVAQVAVVATEDPLREEEVMAIVVPRPGVDETGLAQALFDHAARHMAYFKVPGVIVFRDSLPVTSTQKVRKADLGPLAANPMGDPRAYDFRKQKQALRRPKQLDTQG